MTIFIFLFACQYCTVYVVVSTTPTTHPPLFLLEELALEDTTGTLAVVEVVE